MTKSKSEFIKHMPCPECGSKDNNAVYSDGHEWCFGCGYYKPAEGWKKIIKKETPDAVVTMPLDTSINLPVKARNWYKTYQINDYEATDYGFRWSEEKQWLIFPVFGEHYQLRMFQARCFGTGPKYFTKGSKEQVDYICGNPSGNTLFVCEDLLSAIKIGRLCPAMPLWGSTMSAERMIRLYKKYERIVIWLDSDKTKDAIEIRIKAANIFDRAYIIANRLDPKCVSMPMLSQKIMELKGKA